MRYEHGGDIYTERGLPDGVELVDFSANQNTKSHSPHIPAPRHILKKLARAKQRASAFGSAPSAR